MKTKQQNVNKKNIVNQNKNVDKSKTPNIDKLAVEHNVENRKILKPVAAKNTNADNKAADKIKRWKR